MNFKLDKIEDLSLFGGTAKFDKALHVGEPNIGNREKLLARINDILDKRRFTNEGPYVRELEKRIADYIGVKHIIAMNNGTVALEIAIRALDMKGEVLLPSMTFIATAHALQWQQIKPVFCDIDPATHNIDVQKAEAHITPLTSGILGVHLWGRPADISGLTDLAGRYNLRLLFDAAHAFGSAYQGRMIGNFGDAEVFSFHATKFFNTFEGGAVATNNDELAEKIRLMRNFGFAGKDRVIYIGMNGKMDEVAAAMGLTSLESLDEFIEINKHNYFLYRQLLEKTNGIQIVNYDGNEKTNYQYIVLEIDKQITGISRDLIMRILHAENVIVRRYFYPGCHKMEPYKSYQPHSGMMLPNTERLARDVLVMPTGSAVNEKIIVRIVELLNFIIANADDIVSRVYSARKYLFIPEKETV